MYNLLMAKQEVYRIMEKDEFESSMDNLRYREVVISYKGQRYHIEAYEKKYIIGIFEKKNIELKNGWKWLAPQMMTLITN